MLIQCPECGKQISDKANSCPNCGCSINKINIHDNYCLIDGVKYDFTDIINILPKVGNKDTDVHPSYIMGMIRRKTPLDPKSSQKLADIILSTKEIPNDFNGAIDTFKISQSQSNIPHCPTCNSTDIKKISTTAKVTNIAMFGLLGNKRKKTFHCNNCKYEW